MDSITTALSGFQAASDRLDNAANNIANLNTPGYQAQEPNQISTPSGVQVSFSTSTTPSNPETSNVDLTTQAVEVMMSQFSFASNAAVIRAQDEMTGSLLDIKV
ncbi:MAG TPA: flagellar basal body protein [Chthonomonadaceae bacterium]|nr:flagellar basal body protein [Chthonomonadaceae bacterium]